MSEQTTTQPTYESIPINSTVELRAVPREKAQTMFDLTANNRPYLAKYLPWANETKTVDDSIAFIEAAESKRASGEEYGFGIVVSGQIMGHISIMHLKDGKMPEIGYWIAESASGSGITTKAAKAVTNFGLDTLGLDSILIRAVPENTGSNKIAENLGYKLEGVELDEKGLAHNHWVIRKAEMDKGKDNLVVEHATPDDAEEIVNVQRLTWLDTYPDAEVGITEEDVRIRVEGEHGELIPKKIERWKKGIEASADERATFVVRDNGKIVGFAAPTIMDDQRRIGAIYVLPEVQGKGIGGKLLQKAIEWHGREEDIFLHVASYNQNAIDFYKRNGFEETDTDVTDEVAQFRGGKAIPELEMVLRARSD